MNEQDYAELMRNASIWFNEPKEDPAAQDQDSDTSSEKSISDEEVIAKPLNASCLSDNSNLENKDKEI